jgi:hypothetical protein
MPFLSKVVVQVEDDHSKTLVEDVVFQSNVTKKTYTVPKGFNTDFASVPRLPVAYLVAGGHGEKAAIVHDWLIFSKEETRFMADQVFKEALKASSEPPIIVHIMYLGVRVGANYTPPELPAQSAGE